MTPLEEKSQRLRAQLQDDPNVLYMGVADVGKYNTQETIYIYVKRGAKLSAYPKEFEGVIVVACHSGRLQPAVDNQEALDPKAPDTEADTEADIDAVVKEASGYVDLMKMSGDTKKSPLRERIIDMLSKAMVDGIDKTLPPDELHAAFVDRVMLIRQKLLRELAPNAAAAKAMDAEFEIVKKQIKAIFGMH